MEEKNIVCRINLGVMYQTIYVKKDPNTIERHRVLMEDLADFLMNTPIDDVYIYGVPQEYAKSIERDTRKKQYEKYNQDTKKFHYM